MKTLFLISSLVFSLTTMADSLHCKGMDSRLEIHGADPKDRNSEAYVNVWSREHERARYSDLFFGYAGHATVKQLMKNKIIKASDIPSTFSLDLEKNLMTVKNRGNLLKDVVICEYRK